MDLSYTSFKEKLIQICLDYILKERGARSADKNKASVR
jgi:hypothetical protein